MYTVVCVNKKLYLCKEMILKGEFINVQNTAHMEELKLSKVVNLTAATRLEKRDLKKVKGGTLPCGCGCIGFNGLDNTDESANKKHG